MKKTKKRIITIASVLSAAAIVATSFTVLIYDVDKATPLNMYIAKFNSNTPGYREKNALIESSIKKTKQILDKYEADTGKSAELTLQYANLKQNQSQGEKNYWYSLNRAFKAIDPRLGLYNQQRTPTMVQQAYHNKNTEMMSFYWSPDYNSIGTWIKYVFTETYSVPNMWPMVYSELNDVDTPEDPKKPWEDDLKAELEKHFLGNPDRPLKTSTSPIEAMNWLASDANVNNNSLDDFYTLLSNVIAAWMSKNSAMDVTHNEVVVDVPGTSVQEIKKETTYGGPVPFGLQFMNYLASINPNIPFQEVGPETETPTLMSKGLYMPVNPNADINFRDYYRYPDIYKSGTINDWIQADPFQGNDTPWNPCFSKTSNTLVGQSIFTGLTTWTAIGDANDPTIFHDDNGIGQMKTYLVGEGALNNIRPSADADSEFQILNREYTDKTLTLKIRPIPWIRGNGEPTGYFLSPEDFSAGFKAFWRSVDCGINVNNAYFTGLLGIDFKKTFDYAPNWLRNESSMDQKEFKIFFVNDSILKLENVLDILQKQYFMALPAKHEKVQNIIDDAKFEKIAKPSVHKLDLAQTNLSLLYGLGDGKQKSVWGDLWYASPFYLSGVDQQKISFKINKHYFEAFTDDATREEYKSFNLTSKNDKNQTIGKIDQVFLKYAGSYNLDILFEQFKSGELNKALVEGANFAKAVETMKSDLRYIPVIKNNKSNVAAFNLQVYDKWNEPRSEIPAGYHRATNIIVDTDGNPMWDKTTRRVLYTIDEYGNYNFDTPELKGRKPRIKSNVSDAYYNLIVKDFYTPKEEGGISETLRFAMMNCINYVSLATLVTPGVTNSLQYSFIPYGVYSIDNTAGPDAPKGTYWDFAANKRYMTQAQLDVLNKENLALRLSGNCIWTYGELLSAMIKK